MFVVTSILTAKYELNTYFAPKMVVTATCQEVVGAKGFMLIKF